MPQAIQQAIALAEQLLQLLEEEARVLAEQDLERLQTLPAEKQSLLEQLEQQQAVLANASPEQSAPLRQLLEQCQAANQRNGRVIHSQQAVTKNVLGILRGGDKLATTYAPPGSKSSVPSLSLGLA